MRWLPVLPPVMYVTSIWCDPRIVVPRSYSRGSGSQEPHARFLEPYGGAWEPGTAIGGTGHPVPPTAVHDHPICLPDPAIWVVNHVFAGQGPYDGGALSYFLNRSLSLRPVNPVRHGRQAVSAVPQCFLLRDSPCSPPARPRPRAGHPCCRRLVRARPCQGGRVTWAPPVPTSPLLAGAHGLCPRQTASRRKVTGPAGSRGRRRPLVPRPSTKGRYPRKASAPYLPRAPAHLGRP
jgi:hypothetical protein